MLGGVFGLFFRPIINMMMGMEIVIASNLRKFMTFALISSVVSPSAYLIIKPGSPLPSAAESKLATTDTVIAPGTDDALNQLTAIRDGELLIKILPIAARIVPKMHHPTSPYERRVLIHTPIISKIPPIEQPIFIPNLSRIQLVGKVSIGLRIEKSKTLRVTMTGSIPKFLLTIVLMLENV